MKLRILYTNMSTKTVEVRSKQEAKQIVQMEGDHVWEYYIHE